MFGSVIGTRSDGAAWRLGIGFSILSGMGLFLLLHGLALVYTGGFEHMVDDVYIHLAMASEIARGGYGVNLDEPASAASSILYPFLLTPFAGTEIQRLLPVFWNALGVLASCWLWGALVGRIMLPAASDRTFAFILVLLGPLALHLGGIGFVGMEHALQLAATLAVIYGLAGFLQEKRLGWVLFAGILLGPVLRLENLGISGAACAILLLLGRPMAALTIGVATLLPLAVFGWFLTSLGLEPIPSSIQTKFSGGGWQLDGQPLRLRVLLFLNNLSVSVGRFMLGLCVLWVLIGLLVPHFRRMPQIALWLGIVAVGLAHLTFGRVGELLRYEVYAVVWMVGISLLLIAPYLSGRNLLGSLTRAISLVVLILGFTHYTGTYVSFGPIASRTIHLQHAQMARFAQEVLKAPVAVNDLGRVAWRNPSYVLDLWGLASVDALEVRRASPAPGWAGPLAEARDVELAMIYESWLGRAVGPNWVLLGSLVTVLPTASASEDTVLFYATDPDDVARLARLLAGFAQTLPNGAEFQFAPGIALAD
ncbi:MAG: hypothetical protein AAGC92_11355 [Pseudomonadota bacterium]